MLRERGRDKGRERDRESDVRFVINLWVTVGLETLTCLLAELVTGAPDQIPLLERPIKQGKIQAKLAKMSMEGNCTAPLTSLTMWEHTLYPNSLCSLFLDSI